MYYLSLGSDTCIYNVVVILRTEQENINVISLVLIKAKHRFYSSVMAYLFTSKGTFKFPQWPLYQQWNRCPSSYTTGEAISIWVFLLLDWNNCLYLGSVPKFILIRVWN